MRNTTNFVRSLYLFQLMSLIVVLTLAFGVAVAPAISASNDAAIYALIDSVRAIAAQIQLDGNAADWQGIPTFDDPAGDAGGDASRDIVKVAIAPRENDLLVLIVTSGAPSAGNRAFWLDIDFMPDHTRTGHLLRVINDIQLGLRPQGLEDLRIFEPGQPDISTSIDGIEMAIGDVVEVRIPYAVLAQALPLSMVDFLTGAGARPWIRVSVSSHNSAGALVDLGPAVASYRLIATPYPLDAPLIRPGTPPLSIKMPMGAGSDFDFMTILTTEDTGHGVGHNNLYNLNLIGRSKGPVS